MCANAWVAPPKLNPKPKTKNPKPCVWAWGQPDQNMHPEHVLVTEVRPDRVLGLELFSD